MNTAEIVIRFKSQYQECLEKLKDIEKLEKDFQSSLKQTEQLHSVGIPVNGFILENLLKCYRRYTFPMENILLFYSMLDDRTKQYFYFDGLNELRQRYEKAKETYSNKSVVVSCRNLKRN